MTQSDMIANLEGRVVDLTTDSFQKRTGEKVEQTIVHILQRLPGHKPEIVQVSAPQEYKPTIDKMISIVCSVNYRTFAGGGGKMSVEFLAEKKASATA